MSTGYDTLSEAITALRKEGYSEDFNLQPDCLVCQGSRISLYPEDFQIDKFFHFESMTDPADAVILYAISSMKNGLKGVLVNGYGIYSEDAASLIAEKLKVPRPRN